ncbi:MAG: hypothetical protein IKR04_02255 [Clostridia bacterium]|nr:hypothetical protein [Clostridia bacterium]
MQELTPINETEFAVYDHETKEYLLKIFNAREIQTLIFEELQDYTTEVKTMRLTSTYKQLTHLRERIVEIVEKDIVEIYIMDGCIKIQLPAKVKTDKLQQIDEIFGMNGAIETHPRSSYSILEYEVEK